MFTGGGGDQKGQRGKIIVDCGNIGGKGDYCLEVERNMFPLQKKEKNYICPYSSYSQISSLVTRMGEEGTWMPKKNVFVLIIKCVFIHF